MYYLLYYLLCYLLLYHSFNKLSSFAGRPRPHAGAQCGAVRPARGPLVIIIVITIAIAITITITVTTSVSISITNTIYITMMIVDNNINIIVTEALEVIVIVSQ